MTGEGFGALHAAMQRLVDTEILAGVSSAVLVNGGIAGTHWWVSPTRGIAGNVMAQRQWAFWHPFSLELKRLACQAALAQCPR